MQNKNNAKTKNSAKTTPKNKGKTFVSVIGWTNHSSKTYPLFVPKNQEQNYSVRLTIIDELLKCGYVFPGYFHEREKACTPVLNTGERVALSCREWGAIMAEALCADNVDGFAYSRFAFYGVENYEINLPKRYIHKEKILPKNKIFFPEVPFGYEPYYEGKLTDKQKKMLNERFKKFVKENNWLAMESREGDTSHPLVLNMKLRIQPYYAIYSGMKTIDARLFKDKAKRLAVGDIIQYFLEGNKEEHLSVKVTKLHKFKTFSLLFEALPFAKFGFDCSREDAIKRMYEQYSVDDEKNYGVIGIEFEIESKSKS